MTAMRIIVAGCLGVFLTACEPEMPKRAESGKVVERSINRGAFWPLLLQHCLRTPHCDPTSDFGQGEEQASGLTGSVAWFAETEQRAKEGPRDYGASITLSMFAASGRGGAAGRPLTLDELPATLHAANAKRTRLAIEYRMPAGDEPEPYGLQLHSAWIVLTRGSIDEARVELAGARGVLLSGLAGSMNAEEKSRKTTPYAVEPLVFLLPRNIRDDRVDELLAALMTGETLSLRLYAPDGGLLLADAIYTVGYDNALQEAKASLADPEIKRPIEERCARFAAEKEEYWRLADVTAALRVCDPRSPDQRRRDQAPANPLSAPDH